MAAPRLVGAQSSAPYSGIVLTLQEPPEAATHATYITARDNADGSGDGTRFSIRLVGHFYNYHINLSQRLPYVIGGDIHNMRLDLFDDFISNPLAFISLADIPIPTTSSWVGRTGLVGGDYFDPAGNLVYAGPDGPIIQNVAKGQQQLTVSWVKPVKKIAALDTVDELTYGRAMGTGLDPRISVVLTPSENYDKTAVDEAYSLLLERDLAGNSIKGWRLDDVNNPGDAYVLFNVSPTDSSYEFGDMAGAAYLDGNIYIWAHDESPSSTTRLLRCSPTGSNLESLAVYPAAYRDSGGIGVFDGELFIAQPSTTAITIFRLNSDDWSTPIQVVAITDDIVTSILPSIVDLSELEPIFYLFEYQGSLRVRVQSAVNPYTQYMLRLDLADINNSTIVSEGFDTETPLAARNVFNIGGGLYSVDTTIPNSRRLYQWGASAVPTIFDRGAMPSDLVGSVGAAVHIPLSPDHTSVAFRFNSFSDIIGEFDGDLDVTEFNNAIHIREVTVRQTSDEHITLSLTNSSSHSTRNFFYLMGTNRDAKSVYIFTSGGMFYECTDSDTGTISATELMYTYRDGSDGYDTLNDIKAGKSFILCVANPGSIADPSTATEVHSGSIGEDDIPNDLTNINGIHSDGTTLWLANQEENIFHAYDIVLPDVTRNAALDINAQAGDSGGALCGDADKMWSLGYGEVGANRKLWGYDLTLTGANKYDATLDIPLDPNNTKATGAWYDPETNLIYVVDESRQVYCYNTETKIRETDREFILSSIVPNTNMGGCWGDGVFLWVVGGTNEIIYCFRLDDGALITNNEIGLIRLDSTDKRYRDLWMNKDRMWVCFRSANDGLDRVYSYLRQMPIRQVCVPASRSSHTMDELDSDDWYYVKIHTVDSSGKSDAFDGVVSYVLEPEAPNPASIISSNARGGPLLQWPGDA